jgi:hypothetical protein
MNEVTINGARFWFYHTSFVMADTPGAVIWEGQDCTPPAPVHGVQGWPQYSSDRAWAYREACEVVALTATHH